MAIPWLTVLRSVPWTEVIANAPKVAGGAKKLWTSVAKSRTPAAGAGSTPATVSDPHAPQAPEGSVAALRARVGALEASVAELHAQMLQSSEVIQSLAGQNAQLVARVDAGRRRIFRLTLALVAVGLASACALVLVLRAG